MTESWENAKKLMDEEKYEKALSLLDTCVADEPNNVDLWCLRAKALAETLDFEGALKSYQKALEIDKKNVRALFGQGKMWNYLENPSKALVSLRELLNIDNSCAAAWHLQGIILKEEERYDEALHCFDRELGIRPQNPEALDERGEVLLELKRDSEALQSFEEELKYAEQPVDQITILEKLKRYEEILHIYDTMLESGDGNEGEASLDRGEIYSDRGDTLLKLNRTDEAIASYKTGLECSPGYTTLWDNLENILIELNRHEEILPIYNKKLKSSEADKSFICERQGDMLLKLHRTDEAIASYKKGLDYGPSEWGGLLYKIWNLLSDLGRYKELVQIYDTLIGVNPESFTKSPYIWDSRGLALLRLGRYDEALQDFDKALKIDGDDTYALINRGEVLSALYRTDDAVINYNKALQNLDRLYENNKQMYQNREDYWSNRGLILSRLKRHQEALECYNKIMEIEPDSPTASRGIGSVLCELRRYNDALENYNKGIKNDPNNASLHIGHGNILYYLDNYEEALISYKKAEKIEPENAIVWNNRGATLHKLDRLDEALECLEKACKMDSKDVMAWINRGDVLRDLKKYQESCDCYDKALKINEKNAEAWGKKGLTLNLLKEQQEGDKRKKCEKNAVESFRRGIEICNDALKKEPKDVTSLLTRGQIFGYQKDHVTALISFNDALEVDSNNVEALINKCIAYCNLGLENKARECIKDANNITADRIPNMLLKGKVLKKYGGIETTFPYPGEETISGMSASYRADFTTVIAGCQTDKGQKAK